MVTVRTVRRSSNDGRFIDKNTFDKADPRMVEKERIKYPSQLSAPSKRK